MIKNTCFAAIILAALFLPFSVAGFEPAPSLAPEASSNVLEGSAIVIDNRTTDQDEPALAYSTEHSQYLVVFTSSEDQGYIYGRFIDASTGVALGVAPFQISPLVNFAEYSADVVYSPTDDRFLVVWVAVGEVTTTEIAATVVYGEYKETGPQLPPGADYAILNTTYDHNFHPAIAMNTDDDQMMVVFRSNISGEVTRIRGRMLKINANGYLIDEFGDSDFPVWESTENAKRDPDIAWGSESNTFLVAWEQAVSSTSQPIMVRYFHDTYQEGSEQGVDGSSHTISVPSTDLTDIHHDPAVSYDPNLEMYAVAYRSRADDLNDVYKISGVYVKGYAKPPIWPDVSGGRADIQPLISPPADNNLHVDIAYSGFGMQVCYTQLFSFTTDDYYIYQRDFTYNGSIAIVSDILTIATADTGKQFLQSRIASTGLGRSMCVWRHEWSATDWDIYGQRFMFVPPYSVMLPALFTPP